MPGLLLLCQPIMACILWGARTCMPLDQFLQRYAHRLLHCAGPVDVPADAVQLCTAVVGSPKAGKPVWASPQDGGHDCYRLHVVDGGGAAVQAHIGWVGGLDSRLALVQRPTDSSRVGCGDLVPFGAAQLKAGKGRASCRMLSRTRSQGNDHYCTQATTYLLAFQRLQQRCLFPTDVGASTIRHLHRELLHTFKRQ